MTENQPKRESFLLYFSFDEAAQLLTDEDRGRLWSAVFQYARTGQETELPMHVKIAFVTIREHLKRDHKKYEKICKRNKENIRKRWNTKNTTGKTGIPKNTRNTDTDTDTDTESGTGNNTAYSVPDSLNSPRFIKAWKEWEKHRKELKKRLTPSTAKMQLKTLAALPEVDAIATIEKSITNGWAGLFPDKVETPPPTAKTRRRENPPPILTEAELEATYNRGKP